MATLEKIMVYFDAQGVPASYATCPGLEFEYILIGDGADEFIILIIHEILNPGVKIDCPPTSSLYEFDALQTCENDHWSLIVFESELELVKVASIDASYVVHKAMLNESKSTSILVSCGKFTTTTRLMCYLAHFGGNRRVAERTIAQQLLESNPVPKALHSVTNMIPIKFSGHHGISGQIQLAEFGKTYGGITEAHNYVYIKKEMKIVGLSKKEQMTICRIVASVMILCNMEFSKGNEIVCSILQVDGVWFHLVNHYLQYHVKC